jgi:uncharacterized repeat protein (TIGR01451 family)
MPVINTGIFTIYNYPISCMRKIFTLTLIFLSLYASALDPTHFTVQRVTSPYFVVDGNSPSTGPLTAYVGFKITNTSASTTYTGIKFTITSIGTSVVGQNYTIGSPANGISLIGTLAAGESKVVYFYVAYPASVTPQATFNYLLNNTTAGTKTGTSMIANRSAISANAGGLATQNINNQDLIGGIVYDDITYTLGNIRNGDEADFQVSVSTQFDPAKLVLLGTKVISSTVPGVAANTTDQLYFTTTANQSSGTVTIRWTFRISSYNFTSLILPYAGATSGSTNYKYAISTDLGGGTPISISSTANPLIITKTSDKVTYGMNNTAIFTVTIQNPGTSGISIDKITDALPAGFTFQALDAASQVTELNSTSIPLMGANSTITFEGGVTTGLNTSYTIAAGGSLVLKYTAIAPLAQGSNLVSTASGYIGETVFGTAQRIVNVSGTLPVVLVSFNASWENNKTLLTWTTDNENNSSHFIIERRKGNEFTAIGRVNAKGSISFRTDYAYADSFPLAGPNYYRLKMVDLDGQFKYSPVVSAGNTSSEFILNPVYPNPFKKQLLVRFTAPDEENIQVRMVSKMGAVIYQKEFISRKGLNELRIDEADQLATGIYFLQLISTTKLVTEKLVKVD